MDADDRCSEVLLGLSNSGLMTYKYLSVSKPLNLSNAVSQPERIQTCWFYCLFFVNVSLETLD